MLFTAPTLLVLFSPMFYTMVRYRYGFSDALCRLVFNENGTVWDVGFSEAKYSSVQPGMTKEEVLGILGEPVRRWHRDYPDCAWSYTWQRTGHDNFDRRDIAFSREGEVLAVHREFYID